MRKNRKLPFVTKVTALQAGNAVISATEGIDYDNLERIIKYDEIDEYGDEDWNLGTLRKTDVFFTDKPTWGGGSNSRKRKHSDGVTSQKRLRSTAAGYTSATSKHFNADRYDGNLSIGVQRALPY
ncbi:hypothetical protein NFJ02_14g17540 [Pycnococcus provasolii]